MKRLIKVWQCIPWGLFRLGTLLVLLSLITYTGLPPQQAFDLEIGSLTKGYRFDWAGWTARAWLTEGGRLLKDRLLPEAASAAEGGSDRRQLVLTFVERQQRLQALRDRIAGEYARGAAGSPDTERSVTLQTLEQELAELSQQQHELAPQVETIVAAQVSQVLVDEGFGRRGRFWPPVAFRFSDLPTYLVLSPRDEIRQLPSRYLLPGLPQKERVRLEQAVESTLDVSALVTDVGGIGSWPAMVIEPVSLRSVIDIVAHEWMHNYLVFHPLGQHYTWSRDLTTMNETVASIFGEEVAGLVLARYYPEQLPPPPSAGYLPFLDAPPAGPPARESFPQAMRRIRRRVDVLLAEGQVEGAERYMELERQKLVAQGYQLRRLNQAYFAFHGSYATGPAATDPIGPWLRELRQQSGSLKGFIDRVASMQSLDDLLAALN